MNAICVALLYEQLLLLCAASFYPRTSKFHVRTEIENVRHADVLLIKIITYS